MSFKKRTTVLSSTTTGQQQQQQSPAKPEAATAPALPGVRPSSLDGRPTTSTGTASLDTLLAGHAGFPLGTSILVGEHGTTDFAGVLLRYYAAQGLVQGHHVHCLGLPESWQFELPGLSADGSKSSGNPEPVSSDKMKIAWRYEALAAPAAPRGMSLRNSTTEIPHANHKPDKDRSARTGASNSEANATFCHSFDLAKRLTPNDARGHISFHPSMSLSKPGSRQTKEIVSPLKLFLKDLSARLANSAPSDIHRVLVPSLLSPTLYSSNLCCPEEVLQFLHGLRALHRRFSEKLTAMITLPLSLYPRSSGLVRWMELLSDGVLELVPLQLNPVHAPLPGKSDSKSDEQIQGLLKIHTLPIFHEKGGGGAEGHAREDMSFSLRRSTGLVIKPYSLPPLENDEKQDKTEPTKMNIEF